MALNCRRPPRTPLHRRGSASRHATPISVAGFSIARVLPTATRRTVGAWCFLDHAGPAHFPPGAGMRVGPHPHIGLQTFTWMIEGEVLHNDSLGNRQVIRARRGEPDDRGPRHRAQRRVSR